MTKNSCRQTAYAEQHIVTGKQRQKGIPYSGVHLRYIPCKSVFLKHNLWYGQVHYWFNTGVGLELQSPLWSELAAAGCVRGNINTNRNTHFNDTSKLIIPGIHFCLDHQKMIYLLSSKHRLILNWCVERTREWVSGKIVRHFSVTDLEEKLFPVCYIQPVSDK